MIILFSILVLATSSSGCISTTTLNISEDSKPSGETLNKLNLMGTTDPGANVTIDGIPVEVESDGTFNYTIDVKYGNSTVKVVAESKNGKSEALIKLERYESGSFYYMNYKVEYEWLWGDSS